MNKQMTKAVVVGLSVAVFAGLANAGFGDLATSATGSGGSATVDVKGMGVRFDTSVLAIGIARKQLLEAQIDLGAALGIKDQVDKALAAASIMKDNGVVQAKDADAVENQVKTSKELDALLKAAAEKNQPLTEEGKKLYNSGMEKFGLGLVAEGAQIAILVVVTKEIKDSAQKVKTDPMQGAKVAAMVPPAVKLLSLVPGDVKEMAGTYQLMQKVGANNKIEVKDINEKNLLKGAQ
jgi:hypothetical protein